MAPVNRVRITGGRHRGAKVAVPAGARPTSARVREALFSIWSPWIEKARFLDLFAGSGVVGLEALSRGASCVRFVEGDRKAVRALERNCLHLELPQERWEIVGVRIGDSDASKWFGSAEQAEFELAFVDPPYDWNGVGAALAGLDAQIAEGGRLALEHSSRTPPPDRPGPWRLTDSRAYGESSLSFYSRSGEPAR